MCDRVCTTFIIVANVGKNLFPFCTNQIKKALRGVKVEVTHRGNMRRKYRISGLTSQTTGELT